MRDEKEVFEREANKLREDAAGKIAENKALEEKIAALLSERDSIQLKVEAMLDAMTIIDPEVADAVGR
jgi:hypothetical protein